MDEELGKKIDRTNELLEELIKTQKDVRQRQKKFLSISLLMLAVAAAYLIWSYYAIESAVSTL